jgi:flagellar basal body-associated protein FliL
MDKKLDTKAVRKYWGEVWRRAKESAEEDTGMKVALYLLYIYIVLAIIAGLGFLSGIVSVQFLSLRIDGAKGALDTVLVTFILFVITLAKLIYRTPAEMDKEKKDKLTLKEYDDIDLVYYSYPRPDLYKYKQPSDKYVADTLAFQVQNRGGARLIGCKIWFWEAKYRFFDDDSAVPEGKNFWNPMPDAEKKLLKWDDELRGNNGLIDIGSKSDEIVKLAIFVSSESSIVQLFRFIFSDKPSEIPRIAGEYNITLHLEGQVERDGLLVDIDPILFDVRFDFRYNFVSNSIKVKKHERRQKETNKKDNPS